MKLKKLDVLEHGRTRRLWEEVFSEDTGAFLDYYYFLKTRDNEIYVLEEDGTIFSMLHLNPYQVKVGEGAFAAHYIVGVATAEKHRGRGFMRRLLVHVMEEMYRRKEWFTFLMPAAEEIYAPYDFRFIYVQGHEVLPVKEGGQDPVSASAGKKDHVPAKMEKKDCASAGSGAPVLYMDAGLSDAAEMAAFFEEPFAARWQVLAVRDEPYYQRQVFEQQSEGGGIRLLRAQEGLVGMFSYSREDELEILEPLYLPEYEEAFHKAARGLAGEGQSEIKVYAPAKPVGEKGGIDVSVVKQDGLHAPGGEGKPLIMARLLHPEYVLAAMRVREGYDMDCSFAVLDSLLVQNSRIWRICSGGTDAGRIRVRETEDSEGVLTIAALTSFLFGMKSIEEVESEDGVFLSARLREELRKLEPLEQVFLNEVV